MLNIQDDWSLLTKEQQEKEINQTKQYFANLGGFIPDKEARQATEMFYNIDQERERAMMFTGEPSNKGPKYTPKRKRRKK